MENLSMKSVVVYYLIEQFGVDPIDCVVTIGHGKARASGQGWWVDMTLSGWGIVSAEFHCS